MQLVTRSGLAGALCLIVIALAAGPAAAKRGGNGGNNGGNGGKAKQCQNLGYTNYSTTAGGEPFASEQECASWVAAGNALVFSPVTVDPTYYDFGWTFQGKALPSHTFTFTNRGTQTLSLNWIEYWDADQDPAATCVRFVVSLAPGDTCTAMIIPRVDLVAQTWNAFVKLAYQTRKESGFARATYDFTIVAR